MCVCVESKSAAPVAAVFVDFPKNKCNFLHKNKLGIVRRVQFLTGRQRPMRSFSPGTVTTVALWKSAPMPRGLRKGAVFMGNISQPMLKYREYWCLANILNFIL